MLQEASILHGESVIHELSTLEHLKEGHGRTFVLGAQDEGFQFAEGSERTESLQDGSYRGRKTYSKSMIKHP